MDRVAGLQTEPEIAELTECGRLGVMHLKRFWSRLQAARHGKPSGAADPCADQVLLSGLHAGVDETYTFLGEKNPSFDQFENWILEINDGGLEPERVERINCALMDELDHGTAPATGSAESALSESDLEDWDRHGYVVLHDAATAQQCEAAAQAIYEFIGADEKDPSTWYANPRGHSIWVPLMRHPAFQATRNSPRIRSAFSQLWGRTDLWVSVDQGGFNPPERPGWRFPGPHLHWDTSIVQPMPLEMAGILYLTDTEAEQGAFRCVPGFHRRIGEWLAGLPEGADPRDPGLLETLGAQSIAGRAGDMIIWRQELPHGSSPNRTGKPRVVQYIRMFPSRWETQPVWM